MLVVAGVEGLERFSACDRSGAMARRARGDGGGCHGVQTYPDRLAIYIIYSTFALQLHHFVCHERAWKVARTIMVVWRVASTRIVRIDLLRWAPCVKMVCPVNRRSGFGKLIPRYQHFSLRSTICAQNKKAAYRWTLRAAATVPMEG